MKYFTLVISIFFVSCISYIPSKERAIEKSRIFQSNFDKTWAAVISFFALNNIPIKNIEKSSGLVTTERWINPAWTQGTIIDADCGEMEVKGTLLGYKERLYVTFNVFVQYNDSNATSVQINALFVGAFDEVNALGKVTHENSFIPNCYSTGLLEKRMLDMIASKLSK